MTIPQEIIDSILGEEIDDTHKGIKEWKFSFEETWRQIIDKLNLTYVPDDWQVHPVIHILRGFNLIFLAGTGYGKSLIFEAVTVLGGKKKVTLVICPLKALEADQVKQAREKGLKAILINEDNTKDPDVWKQAEKSAQLVYISLEMALRAFWEIMARSMSARHLDIYHDDDPVAQHPRLVLQAPGARKIGWLQSACRLRTVEEKIERVLMLIVK
ncbi:hypothetical protein C8J57DRAFT_1493277 [Mycena rebaudengoi]|nr:hypothetical protein C8J57DRAFT_1493277 [Mycena rebaudengoi]